MIITGNACDSDTDGDGIVDVLDNCPAVSNNNQSDVDGKSILSQLCICYYIEVLGDGKGDACQDDFDGDGVTDTEDNCPVNPHISRTNFTVYLNTSIDFSLSAAPEWIVTDQVCSDQNQFLYICHNIYIASVSNYCSNVCLFLCLLLGS